MHPSFRHCQPQMKRAEGIHTYVYTHKHTCARTHTHVFIHGGPRTLQIIRNSAGAHIARALISPGVFSSTGSRPWISPPSVSSTGTGIRREFRFLRKPLEASARLRNALPHAARIQTASRRGVVLMAMVMLVVGGGGGGGGGGSSSIVPLQRPSTRSDSLASTFATPHVHPSQPFIRREHGV